MDGPRRDTTTHDSRLDEAMEGETRSLTTGSPAIEPSTRPGPMKTSSVGAEEGETPKLLAPSGLSTEEPPGWPPDLEGSSPPPVVPSQASPAVPSRVRGVIAPEFALLTLI